MRERAGAQPTGAPAADGAAGHPPGALAGLAAAMGNATLARAAGPALRRAPMRPLLPDRPQAGPTLARLVRARDQEATAVLQRALTRATPAEIAGIREQLADAIGRGGPLARVPLDFRAGGETYALEVLVTDLQPIAEELRVAERHATSPEAGRSGRRRRRQSAPVELTDLGRGLVTAVAQLIETLAGSQAGEELEAEMTVRVPVLGVLAAVGSLNITIEHASDGYTIEAHPELGFGLLETSGQSSAQAELLTGMSLEVHGHDARTAGRLLALAIEDKVRSLATQPPPPFVVMAMMEAGMVFPFLGAALAVGEVGFRGYTLITSGEARDPFWIWLADALFGSGHAEGVRREMRPGDYAETADTLRAAAGAESEGDGPDASVEGSIGMARHRRIEAAAGADGTQVSTTRYTTIDATLATQVGGFHLDAEVHLPAGRGGGAAPPGEVELTFGWRTATANPLMPTPEVVVSALDLVIGMLARQPGTGDATDAARHAQRLREAITSAARSATMRKLAAAGGAVEVGVELGMTLTLGRPPEISGTVALTESVTAHVGGEELEATHSRQPLEWDLNGPRTGESGTTARGLRGGLVGLAETGGSGS